MKHLMSLPLPPLWRLAAIGAALACVFLLGQLRGERIAGQVHTDYITAQANQTVRVAARQFQVLEKTTIEYRDRIQTIYRQGETIEIATPIFIQPVDTERFGVNVGFVRLHDAAWSGADPGPAQDADRQPAAIPLDELSRINTHNASACRVWRDQALTLRTLYEDLRQIHNEGLE